jgi:ATP-dependent DNA helicase RecG
MVEPSLDTPVQFVRGVGPQRAELLNKLEIRTAGELLFYLPRDVLDLTHVSAAQDLKPDTVQTVRGIVVDLEGRELASGKSISAVLLDCDGEFVRGIWFNQGWVLRRFQHNEHVMFSGKPRRKGGRWEFAHPRIQWLDADDAQTHGGILPRYGLTEGLRMHEMRRMIRNAVEEYASLVPDLLPQPFRTAEELPPIGEALHGIHLPKSAEQYARGRLRLILQDLLEFQLGIALRRRVWRKQGNAPHIPVTAKVDARIRRLFPFELTAGQRGAVKQLAADLAAGPAMHRLLQAVVAVYGMLATIAAGYQAVLMAPTEVLARQHWETIDRLLAHSRVTRRLLTGSLAAAARRDTLAGIRSGEIQLVIGTQSLIQKDVEFSRLGLAVIDEQHKFGVMQRARFATREGVAPHVLVMTATPIPRSLCLTQFGDLDLTLIKDLPPGRQPVVTNVVPPGIARDKAWEFVRRKLAAGRQALIVCPRIGDTDPNRAPPDGDTDDGSGAEEVFRRLQGTELAGCRVGLLHGRLDSETRERVMHDFRAGTTQALVATSIVEVGIDIPNATLMVIFDAERFGLSQLHQLRGRVSRGRFQGYCFLFSQAADPETQGRLATLEQQAGGFEIAEADFRLRGPGDILGIRQHGEMPLEVADLVRDVSELERARALAFDLVGSGVFDHPEYAALKRRVLDRFGRLLDIAAGG